MINNISAPIAINLLALVAFIGLSGFIAAHILATAPDIPVSLPAQTAHAAETASYSGVIAWASAQEIKITDNFGVSRVFEITGETSILVHGFPLGAATYADLRVLDHVKVTSIDNGAGIYAQTIVVQ